VEKTVFIPKEYTWAEKTAYCEEDFTPFADAKPPLLKERGTAKPGGEVSEWIPSGKAVARSLTINYYEVES